MADESEESELYVKLLKGTVLNLQDRVNKEKKRLASINMYSSRPVYHPYHLSPPRIKPTHQSRSLVFVNPKMNYTKINQKHAIRMPPTQQATVSPSSCRKQPAISVNRTFINPKINVALKKETLTNNPKQTAILSRTSSSQQSTSTACDIDNQTSKGDPLKEFNNGIKVATVSTSERKHPAIYVNRAFIKPKANLALKKDPLMNGLQASTIIAQTSPKQGTSTSSDLDNQKQISKGDALEDFNTGSKVATATSTSTCRKQSVIYVNRNFINPKNIPLKTSAIVVQTPSPSTANSFNSQYPTSKGNPLKESPTGSKSTVCTVAPLPAASPFKSPSEKPVLKSPVSPLSTTPRTRIASISPKAGTHLTLSRSKHVYLKSPLMNATSTPRRFVERHRYKIVREPKPAASRTVSSLLTKQSSASLIRPQTVNTRFNLVKRSDVFTPKNGYSYVSKRCLRKAINLSNSEAGKSYVKKLRKLIIDAGKKIDKKPLVMVSKRKISRVPVPSTPAKRKSSVIPHKSKMKVDHRRLIYRNLNSSKIFISPLIAKHKLSPENQRKWYLGSKRFLNAKFSKLQTVTVQGVKYRVEAGGKNLRRLDSSAPRSSPSTKISLISKVSRINIGGAIFTRTSAGVLKRVNTHKLIVANRVVNKSIATAVAKNRKVHNKRAKKPCLYFNNFGKCKNVKCPYVHDPKKIAVCRRMIQGTCKVLGCPFYHKLDKEKMPTCYYFLKGQCNRDNCIYPHVKVNKNAATCEDFLNGYCSRGEKCTMKHFFVCQKFQEKQVCSHNACKFKAHQITKAKTSKETSKTELNKTKKSISLVRNSSSLTKKTSGKLIPSTEPTTIPISGNLSFISLGNSSEDSILDVSGSSDQMTSQSKPILNDPPSEYHSETTMAKAEGPLRIKPRL